MEFGTDRWTKRKAGKGKKERLVGCHTPNPKGSKVWEIHPKGIYRFFFFDNSIQINHIKYNIKNYHNNFIKDTLKVSQSSMQ